MYLTSLPLVSIHRHGYVTWWKSRWNLIWSASSVLLVHSCDEYIELSNMVSTPMPSIEFFVYAFNESEEELPKLPWVRQFV